MDRSSFESADPIIDQIAEKIDARFDSSKVCCRRGNADRPP
jgi:hypothetical protein